jgi:hypothetical protein
VTCSTIRPTQFLQDSQPCLALRAAKSLVENSLEPETILGKGKHSTSRYCLSYQSPQQVPTSIVSSVTASSLDALQSASTGKGSTKGYSESGSFAGMVTPDHQYRDVCFIWRSCITQSTFDAQHTIQCHRHCNMGTTAPQGY